VPLIACSFFVFGAVDHCAAQTTNAQLDSWVQSLRSMGETIALLNGVRAEIKREMTYLPAPAELDALRVRVEGRPDHPDRRLLEQLNHRQSGKDYSRVTLWLVGKTGRRVSEEWGYRPARFFDTVTNGPVFWGFTPNNINIGATASPLPGYDYETSQRFYIHLLTKLASGGLADSESSWQTLTSSIDGSAKWRVTAISENPRGSSRIEARGSWSDDPNLRTVDEVRVTHGRSDGSAPVTTSRVLTGWAYRPAMGVPAASSYSESIGGVPWTQRQDERVELLSAEPVDPAEIADLLTLPTFGSTDPVRGKLDFDFVLDMRSGDRIVTKRDSAGRSFTQRAPEPPAGQASESRLRTLGWIVLACVFTTLVALRVRASNLK
jgi:hypothetical protein